MRHWRHGAMTTVGVTLRVVEITALLVILSPFLLAGLVWTLAEPLVDFLRDCYDEAGYYGTCASRPVRDAAESDA